MAISVGVVSIAVGIGVPVFYETQIDNAVSIRQFFKLLDLFALHRLLLSNWTGSNVNWAGS